MTPADKQMHIRINYRASLKRWADIVPKSLQYSVKKRGLRKTDALYNSFRKAVALTDQVKRFTFYYSLHGMFVDMNVGKGRSLGGNRESRIEDRLLGTKRRNKSKSQYMWYSKIMSGHTKALARIIAAEYGDLGANAFRLPTTVETTF
jgi:hypothetical protein